jgi:tetratricopeptide (TPR) repeat protein
MMLWYAADRAAKRPRSRRPGGGRIGRRTRSGPRAGESGDDLSHGGRFAEAEDAFRDRIRFGERADPKDLGAAWTDLGLHLTYNHRWEEAADAFDRALEMHRRDGRKDLEAQTLYGSGAVLVALDPGRAIGVLEAALALARSQGWVQQVQGLLTDLRSRTSSQIEWRTSYADRSASRRIVATAR